jgi:hypothetical protein
MPRVNGVYLGEAGDPSTRTCDWCGDPGVKALEIARPRKKVGTGQFVYPCSTHVHIAEATVEAIKNPPKKAA